MNSTYAPKSFAACIALIVTALLVVPADGDRIGTVRAEMHGIESRALAMQTPLEETAPRMYPTDSAAAVELFEDYSHGLFLAFVKAMERLLADEQRLQQLW